MTAKEANDIGKKLVRNGFRREALNHNRYYAAYEGIYIEVLLELAYSSNWDAVFTYTLDAHTVVKFIGHTSPNEITAKYLFKEADKLRAIFNFLRL